MGIVMLVEEWGGLEAPTICPVIDEGIWLEEITKGGGILIDVIWILKINNIPFLEHKTGTGGVHRWPYLVAEASPAVLNELLKDVDVVIGWEVQDPHELFAKRHEEWAKRVKASGALVAPLNPGRARRVPGVGGGPVRPPAAVSAGGTPAPDGWRGVEGGS